jgi:hypothetical protein
MHVGRGFTVMMLFLCLALVSGCATSFKYRPRHDQTYASIANNLGVEITQAQDLRSEDEKLPKWSRKVEVIVAKAVADELEHAALFQRVKIHLSGPLADNRYSEIIELRVKQFRYYNPTNMVGYGQEALSWLGLRGALIARSIPREYICVVEVEFDVLDARTRQMVFQKTYSDSRTLTANGYEGKSRLVQQMSDVLETVVKQFVTDLSKLPLSQGPP